MPTEEQKAKEEFLAGGHADVFKLEPGTKIIAVSVADTMYELVIQDRPTMLVKVWSTDPMFRNGPPKRAYFIDSRLDKSEAICFPGKLVKSLRMAFKFADTMFLSEPIASATIFGDGWHYEVIA